MTQPLLNYFHERWSPLKFLTNFFRYIEVNPENCMTLWNNSLSESCTKSFFSRKIIVGCPGELNQIIFPLVLYSKSTRYCFIFKVQIHLLSFWMKSLADFDSFFQMKCLIAYTKKWSNTLKKLVGCWRQIVLNVFDHFAGLVLKRLT